MCFSAITGIFRDQVALLRWEKQRWLLMFVDVMRLLCMLLYMSVTVRSLTDKGWARSTYHNEGKVLTAIQMWSVFCMLSASCHPLAGASWRQTNS